ncbi:MAG: glycosyltransferase family 2 protein [Candidatus Omnitrophica bacterium]|nr:glycosyltransferase family 2 protein [Candidatus Omnitrophota bacterium]
MNDPKISVVVITKNEEDKIERFLRSVVWADEVIVVDDESTDNTRAISTARGAKVIVNKLDNNFCRQRNIGIENSSSEWILQMDADEVVPPETAGKIRDAINDPGGFIAFKMLRKNFMFSHALKYGGAYNYVTKLFKKSAGSYSENIHEVLNITGNIGKIEAELYHYPYVSMREILDKMNCYTDAEAAAEIQKRPDIPLKEIKYRLTWKALKLFWKLYVKKQGYKDGIYGLIWSVINVIGPEIRWLKIWEMKIKT